MNNELIKEIKGKEYHFKFKSKKLTDLEKITNKNILELLQDTSISNVCRLLKYACLDDIDEYELLDNLLEEMTYEKVIFDIIIETCIVSGIISREQFNNSKQEAEEEKK